MKNKLTSIDIRVLVANIRSSFLGLRLANFYDLNPKTYLLKFARPDGKAFLVIESGRFNHLVREIVGNPLNCLHDRPTLLSSMCIKMRCQLNIMKGRECIQRHSIEASPMSPHNSH